MKLSEIKKFSSEIFVTQSGDNNILYCYRGNNICFIKVPFFTKRNLKITKTNNISTLDDLKKLVDNNDSKILIDDEPFDFSINFKITNENFNTNLFSNITKLLNGFYKEDSLNPEYTGIHIRGDKYFATNGVSLKVLNPIGYSILGDTSSVVLDLKSIVDFLNLDTRKVKNVNKSLFSKNLKTNKLGISKVDDDVLLLIETPEVSFINVSMCLSTLSLDKIKKSKPTVSIKVHKSKILSVLDNYTNVDFKKIDHRKNTIILSSNGDNKIDISAFDYQKTHKSIGNLPAKVNKEFYIVLDIQQLKLCIDNIKGDELEFVIDENSKIIIFITKKDKLVLIGTLLKK